MDLSPNPLHIPSLNPSLNQLVNKKLNAIATVAGGNKGREELSDVSLEAAVFTPTSHSPVVDSGGRRSRRSRPAVDIDVDDDDVEERHLNPFLSPSSLNSSFSRPQFRKESSRAQWREELGMAEVVERRGSLWATTGIVRGGQLYCLIEELGYLAERGALDLIGDDGTTLGIKFIYQKILSGRYGCTWSLFEAYRHLKQLGYIVGRHDLPWTAKGNQSRTSPRNKAGANSEDDGISKLLDSTHLEETPTMFDVHLPNSKFKKSSPGDPIFILRLLGEKPLLKDEVDKLEGVCNGVPLKFCFVDHGRVSFISFDRVELPCLP